MPVILRIGPYSFSFFSNEGIEPPHIHVRAAERVAKYWIAPVALAFNDGFRSGELSQIERILTEYEDFLLEKWYDYFRDR